MNTIKDLSKIHLKRHFCVWPLYASIIVIANKTGKYNLLLGFVVVIPLGFCPLVTKLLEQMRFCSRQIRNLSNLDVRPRRFLELPTSRVTFSSD